MVAAHAAALAAALFSHAVSEPPAAATAPATTPGAAVDLDFRELFDPSPRQLVPSARLRALEGRRVRLVGYMVQMEAAPPGGFYLAPRPVACDEEGAGTADLPPESVWVVVRSSPGAPMRHVALALEVTGILQLGNRATEDGRVTAIRIVLDRPEDPPRPPRQPRKRPQPPSNPKPEVST